MPGLYAHAEVPLQPCFLLKVIYEQDRLPGSGQAVFFPAVPPGRKQPVRGAAGRETAEKSEYYLIRVKSTSGNDPVIPGIQDRRKQAGERNEVIPP